MENDKFNEYTDVAMKVNKVRAARADISRSIRFISAASFFGLSALGSPYALVAMGTLTVGYFFAMADGEKNVIKATAMKHKFKKIAKKFKKISGINIRPEYNYSTRQAGFVLCDLSGKIPVTSFLTSENISDYLTPEQSSALKELIDNEFAYANSYRGKGERATTLREHRYKDFKKIDFDNLTCAFDNVGGVLSNKEICSIAAGTKISRLEYKKFMKSHKKEELWTFSSNLSTYLRGLTDMSKEDKEDILREFKNYFEKYGEQGEYEYQKLGEQIIEQESLKRAM
ncbi:MAG: hypothetical protein OSJ70_04360 [Bacilli bacterium]|nr:hypothetical protein [Bacilli bacterium]